MDRGSTEPSRMTDDVVSRPERADSEECRSTGNEPEDLLKSRYAARAKVLDQVRENWKNLPPVTAEEIDQWIAETWDHPI